MSGKLNLVDFVEGKLDAEEISSNDIPLYIKDNLNQNMELREYQIQAINCFKYYFEDYNKKEKPVHLLFHMATGSGKTLLMAANILYLYEKGYRCFVFFVNNSNIIKKTKQNFLDDISSKYLFNKKISLNDQAIDIREIKTISEADETSINILFTTIQGLHDKVNYPAEESITYDEFEDKKVVLLSDEAHHLNALTKKDRSLTKDEEENKSSWEYTVMTILNMDLENVMLEYTATAGFQHQSIYEKYKDKLLFEYSLARFRKDKYSKEVKVLQSDADIKTRILRALVLSEYRRKVAEKNGLHLKPVVLIKSKVIAQSKEAFEFFNEWIEDLTVEDLEEIMTQENTVLEKAFKYFEAENITLENLVLEMKNQFSSDRCIEVNSKEESEEKQIIVNTLEDRDNQYRIVFAVDKLNEGWDVLNLFDIVRIDNTRGSANTTIKEAQLIGRGARYFPFVVDEEQERFQRKYDDVNLDSELRILEELYYHSINEPKYISDLHKQLKKSGIMPDDNERKEVFLELKEDFKESDFYKSAYIFENRKIRNDNKNVTCLADMNISPSAEWKLRSGSLKELVIMDEEKTEKEKNDNRKTINLNVLPKNVIRKAISKNDFFRFSNLIKYFPHLSSIDNFINSEKYLGGFKLTIVGTFDNVDNILNDELLDACLNILRGIESKTRSNYIPYVGTKEFYIKQLTDCNLEKHISFALNGDDAEFGKEMSMASDTQLRMNLVSEDWYVYKENYGTSEEKRFLLLMKEIYDEMQENGYENIYVIRNEKILKLYHFDDERATEPDFLLWAKKKEEDKYRYFQLLIETKGDHLLETDKWKEDLLIRVESEYMVVLRELSEQYRIIGLPFFNKKYRETEFRSNLRETLKLNEECETEC